MYVMSQDAAGAKSYQTQQGDRQGAGFRIYSKARFGIFMTLIITFLMLIAFIAGGFIFGQESAGLEEPVYEMVTVYSGDTVWGIASNFAGPNADIRSYVREILKVNELKAGELYPGQVLKIPV